MANDETLEKLMESALRALRKAKRNSNSDDKLESFNDLAEAVLPVRGGQKD
jgi:hypothetical protein